MSIKRKAFTLVEMLIVVVIIGILAAALIPRLT
ncbi:MAG: type IV pilin protein [Patescibacteria group bacterium]